MLNKRRDFQTHLWQTIASIEHFSQVEVVVIVKDRSAEYPEIPWVLGTLGAWVTHTYLIFSPIVFYDLAIYFGPIVAFIFFSFLGLIPHIQRICVSKRRQQKSAEITARALFQKAGIQHTQAKIGVLVYCSLLEKTTVVLADRGAELAIPPDDWQKIRQRLQAIFKTRDPKSSLLQALKECQSVFAQYLPADANNVNELPDNLDIRL